MIKRSIQKQIRFFVVLLYCAMLLYAQPITAHAETLPAAIARVEFTKEISGIDETNEVFTFVLKAVDEDVPLPDADELTVTGVGSAGFLITYYQVGEYTYRLYEKIGTAERWTYDDAVYTVKVYVLWNENTNKLEAQTIYYDKEGYKTEAVFTNIYKPVIKPSVPAPNTPKTGDNSDTRLFTIIGLFSLLFILYLLVKRQRNTYL